MDCRQYVEWNFEVTHNAIFCGRQLTRVSNMVLKIQPGRAAFYALRGIAAGEALTADYGPAHHAGKLACVVRHVAAGGYKRSLQLLTHTIVKNASSTACFAPLVQ